MFRDTCIIITPDTEVVFQRVKVLGNGSNGLAIPSRPTALEAAPATSLAVSSPDPVAGSALAALSKEAPPKEALEKRAQAKEAISVSVWHRLTWTQPTPAANDSGDSGFGSGGDSDDEFDEYEDACFNHGTVASIHVLNDGELTMSK